MLEHSGGKAAIGMGLEPGICHAPDTRVAAQVLGDSARVIEMALHALR